VKIRTLLIAALFSLSSCGGGGGGGNPEAPLKAARVNIEREPGSIALGDRMRVWVHISDVDVNGVIIKLRYPVALGYLKDSSTLEVSGEQVVIDPARKQSQADPYFYLIYYIPKSAFGDDDYGVLSFVVRSSQLIDDGVIEVDTDLHIPGRTPSAEFSVKNPLFAAEDQKSIEVVEKN
jgi:hypothetical protein